MQMLLVCALGFVAQTSVVAMRSEDNAPGFPSFTSYIAKHGRTYAVGTKEYDMRHGIYQRRVEEVQQHNGRPHRRWSAVVNHLSDRTEAELSQLRGLRIMQTSKKGKSVGVVGAHRAGAQFLGQIKSAVLPDQKSWAHLNAVKAGFDQSACGSCWALATSIMLQANAEINGYNRTFSPQELVNCVPNHHNCGGSGGCAGATVELAMNWVMDSGLNTEEKTPYVGVDQSCGKETPQSLLSAAHDGHALDDMIAVGFHPAKSSSSPGALIDLKGWERLPENEYEPLLRAVAERGPAAVSVAAGEWSTYGSGIFDSCTSNAVIDHAVTLIGYGKDAKTNEKYWTIKNSWGLQWGEQGGTIRLLRHEGNIHCGTDSQPKVGTGCDGGPSSVHVCGMCGILYDSVVPHFQKK